MSGIVLVLDRTGKPVPDDIIEPIRRAVAHRGPDGSRTERGPNWAMVHAALDATPEASSERQPHKGPDGSWYVADLRLDYRRDLVAALGPSVTLDLPDIELVAAAHRRWGPTMVDHLDGDFAIVVVDREGRLTCVRDHLGVKPVYYWCSPRWVVIASGLREVLAHPDAPSEPNLEMLGEFLAGWPRDAKATVVSGIVRLPAGHRLAVDSSLRIERYWRPPLDEPWSNTQRVTDDPGAYVHDFRDLLTEAVRSRLRVAGPVACELSGGLDSTSVAAIASEAIRNGRSEATELHAFSCLFPGSPRSDERHFIDAAVDQLGLRWQAVIEEADRRPWVDADVAFWSDIPLPPDGAAHVEVGRRAAEAGCAVVLTGHGGDNWFDASPTALAALIAGGDPRTAWAVAMRWAEGSVRPAASMFIRQALAPRRPKWVRRPGVRLAPWVIGPARVGAKLDGVHSQTVDGGGYRRYVARLRHDDLVDGYEAMVRETLDRIGAKGGVEFRHPYLDRRLVEFACRVPVGAHVTPTADRALQRRGLIEVVPTEIVERRSKASFNQVWFREIARYLPETIESTQPVRRAWVDGRAASHLWSTTARRNADGAGGGFLFPLWGIVQVDAVVTHLERRREEKRGLQEVETQPG